jgi:glutathione peroxidase
MALHDLDLNALDGTPGVLDGLRGDVVLVVNVASKCGLTPQYEGLVALQGDLRDQGFSVLGVPCNQFLDQEPGTAEEIATFCSTTYGVDFPLSEKIEVNGDGRHPLYEVLVETADAEGHTGDVRWNFEKFLVDGDGNVVARFGPTVEPNDEALVGAIAELLAN